MYIFTIYDNVAEKAGNLFITNTLAEGERQFHDALNTAQQGSLFNTHPENFSLIFLGEFDNVEKKIENTCSQEIAKGKKPDTEVTD